MLEPVYEDFYEDPRVSSCFLVGTVFAVYFHNVLYFIRCFVCERRESVFCNILKCSRNVIVLFSYDSYRGGGCTSLICGVFKGERE